MGTEITFSADDIPTAERRAELQDLIDSLREYAGKQLTRRERELIDSFDSYLAQRGFLTVKQREALESIHAKHIG